MRNHVYEGYAENGRNIQVIDTRTGNVATWTIYDPVTEPDPRPDHRKLGDLCLMLGLASLVIWPLAFVAIVLGYLTLHSPSGLVPRGAETAGTGLLACSVALMLAAAAVAVFVAYRLAG